MSKKEVTETPIDMSKELTIAVLGGGSFGTAIANIIAVNGHKTYLWMRDGERAERCQKSRENSEYLPGYKLDDHLIATADLENAVRASDVVFISVPSKSFRDVTRQVAPLLKPDSIVISTTKGIEPEGFTLMSQILEQELENVHIGVLSGPNFANEVALGLPTAYVLSGRNKSRIKEIGSLISNKTFRPYFNTDIIGTQLGGAVKNIIAIACGIVVGKKLGENARSSILTRGLQELVYLGKKMGAKKNTFFGLSGIGDLNLSCSSVNSRNFNFGLKLGEGINISKLKKENYLVEGLHSCNAVIELAEKFKIDMPITKAVKQVISGEKISDVINKLLSRPFQFEE